MTFVMDLPAWERLAAFAETQSSAKRHLIAKTLEQVVQVRAEELRLLREMTEILQHSAAWYTVAWAMRYGQRHAVRVAAFDADDAKRRAWAAFTPDQIGRFQFITVTITEDPQ